jgi:hypothetical protein
VRVRGVLPWKRLLASLNRSRNLSPAVLLRFLAIFDSLSTRRQCRGSIVTRIRKCGRPGPLQSVPTSAARSRRSPPTSPTPAARRLRGSRSGTEGPTAARPVSLRPRGWPRSKGPAGWCTPRCLPVRCNSSQAGAVFGSRRHQTRGAPRDMKCPLEPPASSGCCLAGTCRRTSSRLSRSR